MIRVTDLHSTIPFAGSRRPLLAGLNLEVAAGESAAIVGRSGTGKTSLLSILGLMRRPEAGRVELNEHDMSRVSEAEAATKRNQLVGFVFQAYSLIPNLTVLQNVAVPAQYARGGRKIETRNRAWELLELVGLEDFAGSKPGKLSGGEQQRVAIARALFMRPKVILADEPTGALDVETGTTVMDQLIETSRTSGASLVVVTHDSDLAKRLDHRHWLYGGCLHNLPREENRGVAGERE